MPRRAVPAALLTCLALAACDSGDSGKEAETAPTAPSAAAPAAPSAAPAANLAAIAGRHTASVCKSYRRQAAVVDRRIDKSEAAGAEAPAELQAEADALAAIIDDTCK